MTRQTLTGWLQWLETLHPVEIDLGLARITRVAEILELRHPGVPLVTVAGTNGKGSTVACLESMFNADGWRPGCYTSPHVLRYNERIRVGGVPVDDELILAAFAAIDAARGNITLTYFEFATLAAVWCFRERGCDVWVLEVGLGGRLDATNTFDADLAIVTTIDLDHTEWLGDTREAIAGEKMGIARAGRPIVCSDPNPPERIKAKASQLSSPLLQLERDYFFNLQLQGRQWSWSSADDQLAELPRPSWLPDAAMVNAAGAVMAVRGALEAVAVSEQGVREGLRQATLTGRQQLLSHEGYQWLLDVGHNPSAIGLLAERLKQEKQAGKAVGMAFALMQRKDLEPVVQQLIGIVDQWFILDLLDSQSHSPAVVDETVRGLGGMVLGQGDAKQAIQSLEQWAVSFETCLVGAGSFRVVELLMRAGIGEEHNG